MGTDTELVILVGKAAVALVAAMATDAWEQAKAATSAVWRRHRPGYAPTVETALESSRAELLSTDASVGTRCASTLEGRWQSRFETLLENHPEAANDLHALIGALQVLTTSTTLGQVDQTIHAGRDAYTAGRDQTLTIRKDP